MEELITAKEENLINRFFQKIGLFFKKEANPIPTHLTPGKICELQAEVELVMFGLLKFKNIVKKHATKEVIVLINPIVNNLIKEISTINTLTNQNQNTALQVKFVHRYVEWLEKAKIWSRLSDLSFQAERVYGALVEHTSQEIATRINRDLHVIQEYLHNAIANLEVIDQVAKILKNNLEAELEPYFIQLNKLRNLPEDLSLETFGAWRSLADHSRGNCFSTALYLIDNFMANFTPPNDKGQ